MNLAVELLCRKKGYGNAGSPIICALPSLSIKVTQGKTLKKSFHYAVESFIFIRTEVLKKYPALSLHQSSSRNVLILFPDPNAPNFYTRTRTLDGMKDNWASLKCGEYVLPPPAVFTSIYDVEFHEYYIVFRWPRILYSGAYYPDDRRTTFSGQLRESQFIEAQYPPLGRRPSPYPFFVPEHTLDTFRSSAKSGNFCQQPSSSRPNSDGAEKPVERHDPRG